VVCGGDRAAAVRRSNIQRQLVRARAPAAFLWRGVGWGGATLEEDAITSATGGECRLHSLPYEDCNINAAGAALSCAARGCATRPSDVWPCGWPAERPVWLRPLSLPSAPL